NSDCILIMGSNAAENHPISFKWVMNAVERGATLISVDPRFTKTSSKAHIYAALRSGTDVAFLGGMIKYILDNKLYNGEYVDAYTNASFLVNEKFDFQDGLFSGYDEKGRKYDKSTWQYQLDEKGIPKRDPKLKNPFSAFQLLKKHYSRYTLDLVSSITGTPKEKLLEVYKAYSATGKPGKAGTVMYAMGWTQHTVGTQNIRAMSIIQLLLGNMGVAGGGVNALRGESNVQGSTDHGLLFHILPGYLKTPVASQTTLKDYNQKSTPKTADPLSANWWGNYPKYSVSMLKSFYGNHAQPDNEFAYHCLPKLDDGVNYSWITIFEEMYKGKFKGFFAWGMNPAVSGPNSEMTREALGKLDWMVNVNLWETETGAFWKRPGADPKQIKTEVFLLPCSASMEKEGSISNSGRWMQWRYKAVDPPGKAMADGEIIHELYEKIKRLYEQEGGPFPEAVTRLKWDYVAADGGLDIHAVAKEINGYDLTTGKLLPNFPKLMDDGTTSSGCWIYCASYTEDGNMAARRGAEDKSGVGLYSGWSWCWPLNRRIIYNRASVDKNGQPWDARRPVIRWDPAAKEGQGAWVGDVPDGGWPPLKDGDKSRYPFIMLPEGHGRLFGMGLADGPFPEHYEPLECPTKNMMSSVQLNPTVKAWHLAGSDMDTYAAVCDPRFPFVATTYRTTEHWQTGAMTRQQPWLAELQPNMFVEMSRELAEELEIENGEWCTVVSARGKVKAVAMVTGRFKPFHIGDTIVHEVGLPWCFGYMGLATGDSANVLVPNIGDANTMIPESKSFLVNIRKGV
ncbi:MAG: formate dehydrogenase-N subunit alpha, partial [Geobacter sp.]